MTPAAVIRLASGLLRPLMPRRARPVLRAITALAAGVVEVAADGEWDDDDGRAVHDAAFAAIRQIPGVGDYRAEQLACAAEIIGTLIAEAAAEPDARAPDPEDSADLPADAARHLGAMGRRRARRGQP